jgi:NADH-quinone oxidoreductase subunit G
VSPVAPAAEKSGSYVTWEGRRRPFTATLTSTGALSDGRVLHALADEMDVALGLPDPKSARAELDRFTFAGTRYATGGSPAPSALPGSARIAGPGQAVLATWHELLDGGRMSDGEPNLAGTAKPARALVAAATAAELGVRDGDPLLVTGSAGSLTVPVVIADLPERVVWLPTAARDAQLRVHLGAEAGDLVQLAASAGGVA